MISGRNGRAYALTAPGQGLRFQAQRLAIISLLMLAGCAGPAVRSLAPGPSSADAQTYSGRLSVRVEASPSDDTSAPSTAFSVLFDLNGTPQTGNLSLTTPLGTTVAQARWQNDWAVWTDANGHSHQNHVATLTQQALGTPLPLAALMSWLQGQPSPSEPSAPLQAPSVGFVQMGWNIDLAKYPKGQIAITRDWPTKTSIKVRLDTVQAP